MVYLVVGLALGYLLAQVGQLVHLEHLKVGLSQALEEQARLEQALARKQQEMAQVRAAVVDLQNSLKPKLEQQQQLADQQALEQLGLQG
jgi:phosphoenolpyruvate-protein kinase (PTS system EI component)